MPDFQLCQFMSKSSLSKELKTLSKEQLVQIILDAYSANGDFKEYFEFFLNPDVQKLMQKYEKKIAKELNRTKWNYSKARVSEIKRAVKDFSGYNPGPEHVMQFMIRTLMLMGATERYIEFKPLHFRFIMTLTRQIVEYGDNNQMASECLSELLKICNNINFTTYFRNLVSRAMNGEEFD